MLETFCILGFGEVGQTLAIAGEWGMRARCFDVKTGTPTLRAAKEQDYQKACVRGCLSAKEALANADLVLSAVTADQALSVARRAAPYLAAGALYCDMNSVAPDTKARAAKVITDVGAHYLDTAVMAPIQPAALKVPLLLSGPEADHGLVALTRLGFSDLTIVGDLVGQAASIKMIRSVMVKGLEALTAECVLAANRAGVLEDVAATFDDGWLDQANYRLERMLVHGKRRAAEMDEVVRTLEALGTGSSMSQSTAVLQRSLGGQGTVAPALCLQGKLAHLSEGEVA